LDPNVVLGLFIYENDRQEIDFELSRWGDPSGQNAQFVVQPWQKAGNTKRFNIRQYSPGITVKIKWEPNKATFQAFDGHTTHRSQLFDEWVYRGSDVPVRSKERLMMNLWLQGGNAPLNGQPAKVIIRDVQYFPL
jgi:hypothetical protein